VSGEVGRKRKKRRDEEEEEKEEGGMRERKPALTYRGAAGEGAGGK
jgi:hypothetical protein